MFVLPNWHIFRFSTREGSFKTRNRVWFGQIPILLMYPRMHVQFLHTEDLSAFLVNSYIWWHYKTYNLFIVLTLIPECSLNRFYCYDHTMLNWFNCYDHTMLNRFNCYDHTMLNRFYCYDHTMLRCQMTKRLYYIWLILLSVGWLIKFSCIQSVCS